MIETAVEIVRGVVPEPHSLRMHSETFRLGNHPSRHREERDDTALLTQEGISPASASPYSCAQKLFWTSVVTDRAYRTQFNGCFGMRFRVERLFCRCFDAESAC
jgi:hypothetical protein